MNNDQKIWARDEETAEKGWNFTAFCLRGGNNRKIVPDKSFEVLGDEKHAERSSRVRTNRNRRVQL